MVKVKTVRLPQTLPLRSSSHFSAPSPRQPVTTPRQSLHIIINLSERTDKSKGGFKEKNSQEFEFDGKEQNRN